MLDWRERDWLNPLEAMGWTRTSLAAACRRWNIEAFRVEVSDQLWLAIGGGKVGVL